MNFTFRRRLLIGDGVDVTFHIIRFVQNKICSVVSPAHTIGYKAIDIDCKIGESSQTNAWDKSIRLRGFIEIAEICVTKLVLEWSCDHAQLICNKIEPARRVF